MSTLQDKLVSKLICSCLITLCWLTCRRNRMFTEVSTEKKFTVQLANTTTPSVQGDKLSISKYELDEAGVPASFLLGGVDFKRLVVTPVVP